MPKQKTKGGPSKCSKIVTNGIFEVSVGGLKK